MYLTKGERERVLVTSYVPELIRGWADDKNYHLNKEEKRMLRAAATNIEKAWLSFAVRLEQDVYERLAQEMKNSGLVMAAKRTTTFKEEIRMERDTFYDIADYAIAYQCQTQKDGSRRCPYTGKGFRKCDLYRNMIKADVPVVDPDVKGDCPYRIKWKQGGK